MPKKKVTKKKSKKPAKKKPGKKSAAAKKPAANSIVIENIPVKKITKNPWNPNEMTDSTYKHLKQEFKRVGFLQTILVRKHNDRYQIIDGEHRWRAAKEEGLESVPAIVVEMDDATAKTTSINMNRIKGTNNPLRLAELLKGLKVDVPKLDSVLNMSKQELAGFDILLDMPQADVVIDDADKPPKTATCPKCGEVFEL